MAFGLAERDGMQAAEKPAAEVKLAPRRSDCLSVGAILGVGEKFGANRVNG
jgi:hypothetical protein